MFWDSHWDKLNGYKIGAASAEALGLNKVDNGPVEEPEEPEEP